MAMPTFSLILVLGLPALVPGVDYNTNPTFIHPKTKWCGTGARVSNYSDLGSAFETDKCCRDHDHCTTVIDPLQTRYGYTSLFHFTISHCECDVSFYYCLKQSKDTEGQSVLDWFFRLVRMPCFQLVERPVCAARDAWGRCVKMASRKFAELRRLPFFDNNDLERLIRTRGRDAFRSG
ncbi:hypothetical protein BOX15_Mlig031351g2 [Macrostomum lignano]|uniref:Uncharacterized protein n=2 Tax=Macrostomum lignano TaxID=282301 RepID=A0A267DZF8_9PLAT|nr:hypothetical protein BOX15_Mlig031351g3 [Macrostomum lignano]PAA63308.1 hypothetical protein BOX15_Mlig031351g2 [Macrostomum lignano]